MGLEVGWRKAADDQTHFSDAQGGWWPIIREGFAGAWQENVTLNRQTILSFTAVYACVTRIASDIGKLAPCLMEKLSSGIWKEIDRNSPFLPLLRKPNDFQTWSQFIQQWLISKLLSGNTYVLKARDARGIVVRMYVLDPTRVRPLITPDGSIYYSLGYDPLSEQLEPTLLAPQSEIIHDRMPALFHPLVGTSVIFGCGLAAAQGHHIQKSSAAFFKNMAQPSGILVAPGAISDETATRLKNEWNTKFSGKNVGAVAVLGDGLKFEKLTVSSIDSQVIEQLKWSSEMVCSAFGVPAFMVGIGATPTYTNIEALVQQYWSQCLQAHIQDIECLLDLGLGLPDASTALPITVKLDLNMLLRMDTANRFKTWQIGVSGGWLAPNEARKWENLPPVKGGETPYLQQQNYALSDLADRGSPTAAPASVPPSPAKPADDGEEGDDKQSEQDKRISLEAALMVKKLLKRLAKKKVATA